MKLSLKAARVNAGLTQKEVAEKLGVSNKTICDWENGKTQLRPISLLALSSLYCVCVDDIYLHNDTQNV